MSRLACRTCGGSAFIVKRDSQGNGDELLTAMRDDPSVVTWAIKIDPLEIQDDVPSDKGNKRGGKADIDRWLKWRQRLIAVWANATD